METKTIENICIVGTSFMGSQIGLYCAVNGYAVQMTDISKAAMRRAAMEHHRVLESRVEQGQLTTDQMNFILGKINFVDDINEAVANADLVIESVVERLEVKREVFAQLDRITPKHTILATNSSSIKISAIEDATQRPDKVLNLHFYTPIHLRPIVELMRGTKTSEDTIEAVQQLTANMKLFPLIVQKESTGFIFNRVWRAIKKETMDLVNEGVASHEDVDRAWIIATGMPMGVFGLMDMVGLDVVRDIEMIYYRESGDEKDLPPSLLLDKIEKNELGIKTGKGFYTYPDPDFQKPEWLRGKS